MSLPVILVTGGAGYVGSHTTLELLNAGYSVIAVDNLCNAYMDKEGDVPESLKRVETLTGRTVTFYQADLQNAAEMTRIFSNHKIDCVIHFAALKAVGESCKIPLTYYQNNITGSSVLLEVMKTHGVFKLVFSSSATVYGMPQYLPLDELHPTGQGCTNPYGKSKYFAEEIMKDLCSSDPVWGVISLRYFNPVGAHESGEIGEDPAGIPNNLMPYIAQVAVGRRAKLQVFGSDYETPDGTGVRDYIHITDLAVGHVSSLELILKPDYTGFRAFNLGTGKGNSVLEMVKAFGAACGRSIPYELVPRREGDVASSYACAKRAQSELGWRATRGIDAMCADTWNWQSKNPNGFQKQKMPVTFVVLCGGSFREQEEVNLGFEEAHVVGGRKHRGYLTAELLNTERVVEATHSHVINVNRVQMFDALVLKASMALIPQSILH